MSPVKPGRGGEGCAAGAGGRGEAAVPPVGPGQPPPSGQRLRDVSGKGGTLVPAARPLCQPGAGRPWPDPASRGEHGPGEPAAAGEGVPLLPRPFAHSGDSVPALRGSGWEQGTEGSPTAEPRRLLTSAPKQTPVPSGPQPSPAAGPPAGPGVAPSVPGAAGARRRLRETRVQRGSSRRGGEKAQRALMEKKMCFPGAF